LAVVDVRDVAKLMVALVEQPKGEQRVRACSASLPTKDLAAKLAEEYEAQGFRVASRTYPTWLLHCSAILDSSVDALLDVDTESFADQEVPSPQGQEWTPWERSVLDMAASMVDLNIVAPKLGGLQRRFWVAGAVLAVLVARTIAIAIRR
jgi:hypothetical protein